MKLRRPSDGGQLGEAGTPTVDELGRFRQLLKVLEVEYGAYRWSIVTATALTAIAAIIELVIIFLIAGLGTAITQRQKHFTLQLGIVLSNRTAALALIGAVLVRAAFDLIATRYKFAYMKRYELVARKELLHDFLDAEWHIQSTDDSGNVQTITVTYLRQAASSLATLQDALTTFVASGWFLVGSVIAEGYKLLAMLAVGALLAWMLRPLIERSHSAGKDFRTSQLVFSRLAMEMYDMAREIRLFRATDHVHRKIAESSEDVAEANRKNNVAVGVLASLQASATYLVGAVGLFAIVLLAVKNPEPLVVVVLLVYRGLGNLRVFQADYQSLVNSMPSMMEMQENRTEWRAGAIPHAGVEYQPPLERIEFDHVGFSYPGGNVALTDASFTIERGDALGLVGPSGSGKSTIVQLLLRLRLPSSGEIRVNGVNLADLRPGSWFGHAVLVPQEAQLFSATVLENVTSFRADITRAGAEDALRRAHVLDEILALPDGLDTMLGETGRALSGGQQQRVCIARALAAQPDVLILDEPTSGLDPISEEGIRATLQSLKGKVTIVIIAHRFTTLRVCETVMAMENGRIAAHGNREELEAEGGYYAEAVRLSKLI